nr:hypothetical protein [Ruminococcus bromii]
MSTKTAEIAKMIDMLPDSDKKLACELIKKLVLAWDSDYTKVTEQEYKDITEAENGDFVSEDDIDWDNLSRYAN